MASQAQDIQTLKTDVAVIKSDLGHLATTVTENHSDIISRMDRFAFVSQKDYNKDKAEFEKRLKDVETLVYAGGVKASNTLFGNVSKALLIALGVGMLIAIGVGLASLYPAIKGVVS